MEYILMPYKKDILSILQHKSLMPADSLDTDTTRTDTSVVQQDTLKPLLDTIREDTLSIQLDTAEIKLQEKDSVASVSKEQDIDISPQPITPEPKAQVQKEIIDTTQDLYEIFGVTQMPISERLEKDPSTINFLYNIPAYAPKDTQKEKSEVFQSLTTEEQIKPKIIQPEKKQIRDTGVDWAIYFIAGIFILMGWSRLFYKKYFDLLFKSMFFYNYSQNLFHEKSTLTTRVSTILNFTYFLSLGLFVFQIMHHFNTAFPIRVSPLGEYGILTLFFVAWYSWNAIFIRFVGSVFIRRDTFEEYFHNYNIYRKIAGISIFPFLVIVQFINEELIQPFIIAGLILFGILYFMHILRGLQIFIKNKVSIFYLILYLCALEILPLIVLYERFIGNF